MRESPSPAGHTANGHPLMGWVETVLPLVPARAQPSGTSDCPGSWAPASPPAGKRHWLQVIFLRHEESWGFLGSPLLPEWNLLAFPLPTETWGVVDVIGFRVGLAFLLSPESLGWSSLCTPLTAVPLPCSPAHVPTHDCTSQHCAGVLF